MLQMLKNKFGPIKKMKKRKNYIVFAMGNGFNSNICYNVSPLVTKCKHLSFESGKASFEGRLYLRYYPEGRMVIDSLLSNNLSFPHTDVNLALT